MLRLYNTLTRKKEEFEPIDPQKVGMYNCGPTVYDYAHIGNLRSYIFADTLRRTLEYSGYKVNQVMNITDIGQLSGDSDDGEDKMTKALKKEGKPLTLESLREHADFYAEAFKKDLSSLNILMPHKMPKASEHIEEDIELLKVLDSKGALYKTSDGLYFDISKYPEYGKLGNINLENQKEGARVEVNKEKKHPADFSLWKFNEIGWDSPWGKGFPGWHIECSAMSKKYLEQPFDIHTGGVDNIGTHHNGEIAQSETAYEKPLANIWMHGEHLIVKDSKMAKSAGNFITIQTLKDKGIHPLSYRYFLLQAHYRTQLEFSWEALQASQTAFERVLVNIALKEKSQKIEKSKLLEIVSDDLDTPQVLSLLGSNTGSIDEFDQILGLNLAKLSNQMLSIPEEIKEKMKERDDLKKQEEWKEADKIREEIESLGYILQDKKEGSIALKSLISLDI